MSAKVHQGPELRILPIEADGQIKALSAVGCAGAIGPNNTPARRGQVLFDENGFQVVIHRVDAAKREVTLRLREGVRAGFRGTVTDFQRPFNAYVDRLALSIGQREWSRVEELAIEQGLDSDRLRSFLGFFRSSASHDADLGAVRSPDRLYTIWLCTSDEASEIIRRVQIVARKAVIASWSSAPADLISASWWLSRTSESSETVIESAAAIQHAGDHSAARTLLQASGVDWNASRQRMTEAHQRLESEANLR